MSSYLFHRNEVKKEEKEKCGEEAWKCQKSNDKNKREMKKQKLI